MDINHLRCCAAPQYKVLCKRIYTVLSESFDIEQHKFNTKHFFAEYLIRRARAGGAKLNIDINMLVISHVYTRADKRRCGYASALI